VISLHHLLTFEKSESYAQYEAGIVVPVSLSAGRKVVDVLGSIDTGATHSLFEAKYAERLGLELERGERKRFVTANSSFEAFGHELSIDTLGIVTHAMVYFFAQEEIRRNVLGRLGWLDRVRLAIVEYDRRVYLSAHD